MFQPQTLQWVNGRLQILLVLVSWEQDKDYTTRKIYMVSYNWAIKVNPYICTCLIKIVVYIIECSSTLYVGLMGTFQMLIQKYTGMVSPFLRFN